MGKGVPGIKQGMWKPVHVNMKESREETEMALFACIRHVLKKTGLQPSQVNNLHESIEYLDAQAWSRLHCNALS